MIDEAHAAKVDEIALMMCEACAPNHPPAVADFLEVEETQEARLARVVAIAHSATHAAKTFTDHLQIKEWGTPVAWQTDAAWDGWTHAERVDYLLKRFATNAKR